MYVLMYYLLSIVYNTLIATYMVVIIYICIDVLFLYVLMMNNNFLDKIIIPSVVIQFDKKIPAIDSQ